jgi:Gpi18-like mannosyltransferase
VLTSFRRSPGSPAGTEPAGETPAGSPPAAAGWRRSLLAALVVWLGSHIAYALATVLNWHMGGPTFLGSGDNRLMSAWLRWDAWHYLRIADGGYGQVPVDAAFFPGYPLLIRAADAVLPGSLLLAALAVSSVAGFGALTVLHRLVAYEVGDAVAERTIFYFVAWPTAFFLAAPYNHSLFILLATGFLYAIRRGNWWLAGGLGALASGTRSVGVLLALPFAYEYLRQRDFKLNKIRFNAAAVALVPVGLLGFVGYCGYALGDPLAFSHAQTEYWNKTFTWPGHTLWLAATSLGNQPWLDSHVMISDLTVAVAFISLLVLCFAGPWKLRGDQYYLVAYAAPILLLPLFFPLVQDSPLSGMTRYVLDLAVIFMILGKIGERRSFDRLYPLVAIALQVMFLLLYLRGAWTF